MSTINKDFEFLSEILKEFVDQKAFIKKLQLMHETDISGWEIWLQVELALFFQGHEKIAEWNREQRHSLDMRKSSYWSNASIDFYLRKKYAHDAIPLEIKQHKTASQCIKSMGADARKFSTIKSSSSTTSRPLWCMGIHAQVEEQTVRDYISKYDCPVEEKCILVYPIKNTAYMMTLF